MKKLLALIFAFLLPACAVAEGYSFSLSAEANEEAFAAYVVEMLQDVPAIDAKDAETYALAIGRLLNELQLNALIHEDAAMAALSLAGGYLMDVTLRGGENEVQMSTSLLPSYAFVKKGVSIPGLTGDATEEASLLDGKFPVHSVGLFHGDAYEGGTNCFSWEFESSGTCCKLDLVTDNDNSLRGISATVFAREVQIATISIGVETGMLKCVIGLGLTEQNYWWELTARIKQQENLMLLDGESREWMAAKPDGFAWVSARCEPITSHPWKCSITISGERYLWDAVVNAGADSTQTALCASKGTVIPAQQAVEGTFTLGGSIASPLKLKFGMAPSALAIPEAKGLTVYPVEALEDEDLYEKISQQFSLALITRLTKLLPMKDLLTLTELFPAE